MIYSLYSALLRPATPALEWLLRRRLARGKEHPTRLGERRGIASAPRPVGKIVWLHAASVGESLSLLPLVTYLRQHRPDLPLLLTTGTVTSARLMAARLPAGVIHQFMPVDHPDWVARFLDHWRPDAVVWSESEFWPAMLAAVRQRGIPAVLVNARLSERSYRRWRWTPRFARAVLSVFALCLAQTKTEVTRLRDLGAARVEAAGNLKYAATPLPDDPAARAQLTQAIEGRPVLLWASTHPGEEDIAVQIHQALRRDFPQLLTMIVPRHPERGAAIAAAVITHGLSVETRSRGQLPAPGTDIYIADTLGELGLFYRLCPRVIMGGSFVGIGGHNPIEPAQLGAVVVCGPSMYNFTAIQAEFLAAHALLTVTDTAALLDLLHAQLQNPAAYDAIGQAAVAWTGAQAGVIERIYAALVPFLPAASDHRAT